MSAPLSPTTNSSFIGEIGHFLMRSISSKTLSDRISSSPSSVTKSNSSSSLDIKANPSIALACKLNNLEPIFTEAEYVYDGAELSNLSVAGFNVEAQLGGNCPDQSAQEYIKELKSGAFEFDPTHFYAFGSLEPVGVIIVSIDKEKRNGCVRSKLGVFRYPLDPALSESHDFYKCAAFVLAKFMSRYGYLWTSQSRSSTTTLSETAHDSDHTRYHSVHSMSHKGASESDQKELQAASDAFFASARYSDELTADQLVPLLKSFGNCFKYHPVQHVVVDVYDLTEGVPCFYDVEAVFGVPTVSVFAFDRKGPALIDLFGKDQDLKRPGVDEFKDPGRSPIDEPEKRNGLFMEIYDIEVKYQKNLEMMMDMYACFETRIKEDKAFSMDKYHLINCFPDVSEFKKISAAFSSVLKSKYFDQPKPNMQVYIRLLLEYVDQFEPLILKAVKDVTPFQEMLDKFKDKDDVKMQFEIAYELIQKKNNGTYHDINTLVALPFSRLHYLRSGVTSILQCTPTTHPLSPLFLTTATRIHILSRRIECTMEELEAKTFMIKLGKALDNSEIVSAHRSYLSDYVVEASPLNWEVVSGGVGCGIMLLSDMVLFLGKWQERSGGKVAYRVQRYVVMDDLVAVERDGREIIFVIKYTLNPNAEKNETILRFICESEVYCDNMFREIRHVWISHTWGHCYIGASHKRIPIYVMKRDEISVYYRMLKSVDSLEKAGFKNTVYADVGFVFGIDSSIMENIASQVIKKYTYFGAFSSPKIQTDFLFRTTQSHSIKPHQLHSLHGQETLSSTLFHTSTTPLHFTSPQSPLHTHLRKLHLTTTLHTFPRVSLLRKASFACKQILKTRSRRQSTASLFSNTDTDRASITDSDAGSFYASERGDSSPEKKIGFGFGRVRTMSNVSVDSKFGGGGGGGIRAVGTQGRRPTWFRKTVGGTSPVKKRCWDRLSDLEVLRGLCEEIEGREEKMAYNNAAVAAATLPESIVYSRAECIATATRSKLASGFILALRHLLNSAIGPFTFCETFILTRPIQQLLLKTPYIKEHATLKRICVQTNLITNEYFRTLFSHLHKISTAKAGTTSPTPSISGFLAASLFPHDAGKHSPYETRYLCLSVITLLIEMYPVLVDGKCEVVDVDVDGGEEAGGGGVRSGSGSSWGSRESFGTPVGGTPVRVRSMGCLGGGERGGEGVVVSGKGVRVLGAEMKVLFEGSVAAEWSCAEVLLGTEVGEVGVEREVVVEVYRGYVAESLCGVAVDVGGECEVLDEGGLRDDGVDVIVQDELQAAVNLVDTEQQLDINPKAEDALDTDPKRVLIDRKAKCEALNTNSCDQDIPDADMPLAGLQMETHIDTQQKLDTDSSDLNTNFETGEVLEENGPTEIPSHVTNDILEAEVDFDSTVNPMNIAATTTNNILEEAEVDFDGAVKNTSDLDENNETVVIDNNNVVREITNENNGAATDPSATAEDVYEMRTDSKPVVDAETLDAQPSREFTSENFPHLNRTSHSDTEFEMDTEKGSEERDVQTTTNEIPIDFALVEELVAEVVNRVMYSMEVEFEGVEELMETAKPLLLNESSQESTDTLIDE